MNHLYPSAYLTSFVEIPETTLCKPDNNTVDPHFYYLPVDAAVYYILHLPYLCLTHCTYYTFYMHVAN